MYHSQTLAQDASIEVSIKALKERQVSKAHARGKRMIKEAEGVPKDPPKAEREAGPPPGAMPRNVSVRQVCTTSFVVTLLVGCLRVALHGIMPKKAKSAVAAQ